MQLAGDAEFRSLLAKEVLPETAAAYEQSSEDGAIFRIYRFGGIEVRTIQARAVDFRGSCSWRCLIQKVEE